MNIIKNFISNLYDKIYNNFVYPEEDIEKKELDKILQLIFSNKPSKFKENIYNLPLEFYINEDSTPLYFILGDLITKKETYQTEEWKDIIYTLTNNVLKDHTIKNHKIFNNPQSFYSFFSIAKPNDIINILNDHSDFFKNNIFSLFQHESALKKFSPIFQHINEEKLTDYVLNSILNNLSELTAQKINFFQKNNPNFLTNIFTNFNSFCSEHLLSTNDVIIFYHFFSYIQDRLPLIRNTIMDIAVEHIKDSKLQLTCAYLGNIVLFEEVISRYYNKTNIKEELHPYLCHAYLSANDPLLRDSSKNMFDHIYGNITQKDINEIFSKQFFIKIIETNHLHSIYMLNKIFAKYKGNYTALMQQKHLKQELLSSVHKDNMDFFAQKIASEEFNILKNDLKEPFKKNIKRL